MSRATVTRVPSTRPMPLRLLYSATPETSIMARLLGLAGTGMMIAAILATQSRGGLLGIVAVCGVFGARRIRSKAVLLGGGGIGLLGLSVVAGVGGRQSGGAAESGAIDESAMGRLEAWKAAWRMAIGRPLTGVGLDCYVANFYYYSDWWEGFAKAVHSTWFAVLAEGGLPGLVAFVMMCVRIIRTAVAACNALAPAARGEGYEPAGFAMAQAVLSGMAGFIVSGTFLTQAFTWPVYILLALAAALGPYAQAAREAAGSLAGSEKTRHAT
ncbi:MAG: O-antigen ligase domain-containing protein [Acetobacteraceae bacterium]|nr:MAG: O-antigen ligase domain-containing protein [Acetobacteraceae bacterium]